MKKLFSFVAAALMSASMFATPAQIPTVANLSASYDVVNNRVICLYFDEQVCNDIVWVGTYKQVPKTDGTGYDWSTDVEELSKFESLEGFDGWYVVEYEDTTTNSQGKPVQLKSDGTFAWDYQSGDKDAWANMSQEGQIAVFEDGYDGEANCTWANKGAYIYEVAYWKKHNTPCVDKPKHDYTFTVYMPEFCEEIEDYADSVFILGGFDWNKGVEMEKKFDLEGNAMYYVELDGMEEGTEYKFRCGTKNWDVQVQLNGADLANMTMDTTTDVVLHFDGEGYGFKACDVPVPAMDYDIYLKAPAMCDPNISPAIVGSGTPGGWDAGTAMEWDVEKGEWHIQLLQAEGEFKFYDAQLGWDNEIQMYNAETGEWGATPNLKLAGETPIVIDYSDASLYRWKMCEATGLENVKAAIKNDGKYFINGTLYIKKGNKLVNVLGL